MLRPIVLVLGLSLTSCGPQKIELADGSCEKISVGDHVQGIAVLHSYAGLPCMHCGAYLTRDGCEGRVGFRTATDAADKAYNEITRRHAGESSDGPIERRVFVSGPVIPNGADGSPLINADHLSLAR
jgi:hypothetical protein